MNKSKITCIVADDHPIMRKGLSDELQKSGYQVIGSAENGNKALSLILEKEPVIAILDLEMPILNGFEVLKQLQPQPLETKFIAMTYHKSKGYIVQANKLGFNGYLLKEDNIIEIEKCIQTVLKGETYYSESLEEKAPDMVEQELKKIKRLTPTERTVIRLISKGHNSAEISEQLTLSLRTVQNHRSNIIAKLDLEGHVTDALIRWTEEFRELVELL